MYVGGWLLKGLEHCILGFLVHKVCLVHEKHLPVPLEWGHGHAPDYLLDLTFFYDSLIRLDLMVVRMVSVVKFHAGAAGVARLLFLVPTQKSLGKSPP